MICGKICCGKSVYAEKLRQQRRAALLSCDELTLALFDEQLGSRHDTVTKKVQDYLFQRAAELLELGVDVILEWGFWTKESRRAADFFFRGHGFETEWHYVEVSDRLWRERIEKRNREGPGSAYFVDANLMKKCAELFEPPEEGEMDAVIRC